MDYGLPLSNNDIEEKMCKYGINADFVPYRQLKYINSLDEIMPCFLLYQHHFPIGHWVALFRNSQGINYFDPTGRVPDVLLETNYDHPAGRVKMNADFTYLNNLLYKCEGKIIYNDYPLQTPESNTCGAWVGVRLLASNIFNDDFVKLFEPYDGEKRQRKIWALFHHI